MENKLERVVIYPKDIIHITGRSKSYAYKMLNTIKKRYGKKPDGLVSLSEFCEYTGLNCQDVKALFN
jgi:hypothetical protein